MAGGRKPRQLAAVMVVVLLTIGFGYKAWQTNNTPERSCERARWEARGSWEDAIQQLDEIHARLAADDAKLIERGQLDLSSAGRWRMWRSAQEGAERALAAVYQDPITARTAATEASAICRVARETSPKVQRNDDADREYTPGGRALKSCSKAAQQSEKVWETCNFMVPEVDVLGGPGQVDLDFFKGCSI